MSSFIRYLEQARSPDRQFNRAEEIVSLLDKLMLKMRDAVPMNDDHTDNTLEQHERWVSDMTNYWKSAMEKEKRKSDPFEFSGPPGTIGGQPQETTDKGSTGIGP